MYKIAKYIKNTITNVGTFSLSELEKKAYILSTSPSKDWLDIKYKRINSRNCLFRISRPVYLRNPLFDASMFYEWMEISYNRAYR